MDWGPIQLYGECLSKEELWQGCENKINIGIFLWTEKDARGSNYFT